MVMSECTLNVHLISYTRYTRVTTGGRCKILHHLKWEVNEWECSSPLFTLFFIHAHRVNWRFVLHSLLITQRAAAVVFYSLLTARSSVSRSSHGERKRKKEKSKELNWLGLIFRLTKERRKSCPLFHAQIILCYLHGNQLRRPFKWHDGESSAQHTLTRRATHWLLSSAEWIKRKCERDKVDKKLPSFLSLVSPLATEKAFALFALSLSLSISQKVFPLPLTVFLAHHCFRLVCTVRKMARLKNASTTRGDNEINILSSVA